MDGGRVEVVLVDDAPDVRAVVGRQLRLSRHFTVVAEGSTGQEAVTLAGRWHPPLLVLDASMPDMDGLEALPAILRESPGTRVVVLSGFGGPALELAATQLGAAAVIEKSVPVGELPGRLLGVLGEQAPGPPDPAGGEPAGDDPAGDEQVRAALQASEERFRLLVDGVRDYAIFMLDTDGHVSTWNQGAERMKGYRADEIIGQHFSVFYTDDARAARHPEHELELATRDGRYEEEGWRVRRDGSLFWANVVITALFDRSGRLAGFGKVTRDVTERRAAVQERDRALVELAEANRLLRESAEQVSQFVALVAHELRSPIAAVSGAADILSRHLGELSAEERAETLANITRGSGRMRQLLEDLLTAARLEAGEFGLRVEEVGLADAVSEALAGLPDGPAAVEVDCPPGLRARADRVRLVQILTNLMGNARQHGRPPIRLQVRTAGTRVEVRVSDGGAGVPAVLVPRLFDKFSQAAGAGNRGAGLGLFIVRELARAQGGDAWYEEGERPAFAFSLPAAS